MMRPIAVLVRSRPILVGGAIVATALALALPGCGGGGADGGTAEYGQKFEKPATTTPPPAEKPETQKASKVLSPRERKAKESGG